MPCPRPSRRPMGRYVCSMYGGVWYMCVCVGGYVRHSSFPSFLHILRHKPKSSTASQSSTPCIVTGQEFLIELRRVTALTAQSTAWDPKNVCRAIAHAATAQRCVSSGFRPVCVCRVRPNGSPTIFPKPPTTHPTHLLTPTSPTPPTTHSPRRQYILGMDGRFVLTPLLFVPEWLADGLAFVGSKRHLLKPAWLHGGAQDDPVRAWGVLGWSCLGGCMWGWGWMLRRVTTDMPTIYATKQSIRVVKEGSDETKDVASSSLSVDSG